MNLSNICIFKSHKEQGTQGAGSEIGDFLNK